MDRFRSLYNVAKNNGRKIVVSPKTAYLLSKLVQDKRLDLPDPLKDNNVLVYYKRKKSGEFNQRQKKSFQLLNYLLLEYLPLAGRTKKKFLVLSYTDEIGLKQNLVFNVEEIDKIQPDIYNRVIQSRK